ncbi:conserved exported hypothetical protein [uncultured Desulfobacterium sp.]|uniref:Uncharacterized protein n=1 Tax=uncultured Desulfobacterium sp. TaxID=201089 RepID=A0A445MTW3_9BACT|nr:conserved exported hypothetical protein [uncultured Desulfobacterium sp.]
MKDALKIFVVMILVLFAESSWAGETAMQQEINQLKQRLEELEKKNSDQASESSESDASKSLLDRISFAGIIAGAYQYEDAGGRPEAEDFGRGALPVQAEVGINPTEADEVFFKFGFASGNGLNTENHSFALAPWAADLEDDVKDINGRNRDYLLTAWYKHTFTFSEENSLGLTGGIIDATDYLDENAYANDEFTQFMNEALVNGPHAFLPSYDLGGAMEWEAGGFAVKGVVMQIGENDDGNAYHFYGAQMGYTIETPLGEGTYRILYNQTSDDFCDPGGEDKESLKAGLISFDQALGEILGAWIRFGWSDDKALVCFQDLYSGGINISGKLWGREQDNIGVGYGRLRGGNDEIDTTQVAEVYARFALNEVFAVTLDLQHLDDEYKAEAGDDIDGWISGIRLTAEF